MPTGNLVRVFSDVYDKLTELHLTWGLSRAFIASTLLRHYCNAECLTQAIHALKEKEGD